MHPAHAPPAPAPRLLVAIPACAATHVLGGTRRALARGDLALVELDIARRDHDRSHPHAPATDAAPGLLLRIGAAAFPLASDTPFGTLAHDARAYVFALAGVGGYVQITLPPEASDVQRDALERALVHHGLLETGLAAHADELGRSAQDGARAAAERIRGATERYIADTPPTAYPVAVPASLRAAAASVAAHGTAAHDTTSHVRLAADARAQSAGAWIARQVDSALDEDDSNDDLKSSTRSRVLAATDANDDDDAPPTLHGAMSTLLTTHASLTSAAASLTGAAGTSLVALVAHEFGADVAGVLGAAGRGLGGAGKAVGDVGAVVSGVWWAGKGVVGGVEETK